MSAPTRLAPLLLLGLLWSAPAAAAQSPIGGSAAGMPIKGDVLLQADQMDYDVDNKVVTARGHVEIDSDGRILLADSVSYDQVHDTTTASGHVSLTDEKGNVAFASHVVLTDKMRDGALRSFAALIGKNGRMVAASATRTGGRFIEAFDDCAGLRNRPFQPLEEIGIDIIVRTNVPFPEEFLENALQNLVVGGRNLGHRQGVEPRAQVRKLRRPRARQGARRDQQAGALAVGEVDQVEQRLLGGSLVDVFK